jgi:putative CocE/NonD family hydrolase
VNYRERSDFPHAVRELENVFITLADGCRLAARIWMPANAEQQPVPAILEYIPYRKRDFMRARDEPIHHYLAGHGYVAVRVDLRGSGDSDGVLVDEYHPQEQADALEVIDWLAAQPWCDGNVGMTGISWGGFNSLQVAASAPPALKAIISLCSADDRYSDDAHFMGGCLLNENQIWGTVLFGLNALPPDPEVVGERWRDMWLERLHHNRPFPAVWLQHQRRDDYWKQGSVCQDYSRIRCPVYAIGGWADGYSNAIGRLLAGLPGPRKGLIGPWAHAFPHNALPGPSIGYLQESLRWWDHWLKGADTGIMDEPMLRVWMQDSAPPQPLHTERSGRWVAETTWPSARIQTQGWYLGAPAALLVAPGPSIQLEIQSPQTTGSTGGDWCGFGSEGEAPMDQRADDGRSMIFDSPPLQVDTEILGAPRVVLRLSASASQALVAVRLNDVAPDGTSSLVTYGVLNLSHRDSHEQPQSLNPGEMVDVTVQLNDIAHRFPAGHQFRLALSTSYWPLIWPAPAPFTLTVECGASRMELPLRVPHALDEQLRPFEAAEAAPTASTHSALRPHQFKRSFERDLTTHDTIYRLFSAGGDLETGAVMRIDSINMELGHTVEREFSIGESNPLSARAKINERLMMRRGQWSVKVHAETELTASAAQFRLRARLSAREGDSQEEVYSREWDETIPRDFV